MCSKPKESKYSEGAFQPSECMWSVALCATIHQILLFLGMQRENSRRRSHTAISEWTIRLDDS